MKKDKGMLIIDIIGITIIVLPLLLLIYSFIFYQYIGVDWWTLSPGEHRESVKMIIVYNLLK